MILSKVIRFFLPKLFRELPLSLGVVNFIFQRIFRINCEYEFPVHYTSRITGELVLGDGVWLSCATSGSCYIQAINGVEIGDNTIFAPGVKIISANHDMRTGGWVYDRPIKIGKNVWVGANAVILPGVHIGNNSIIGAGAIVVIDVPENVVAVGVPAVKIKELPQ